MESIVKWELVLDVWQLLVKRGRKTLIAATVYTNSVWYTWDQYGVGGENSSSGCIAQAKKEAAASAIEQGFI